MSGPGGLVDATGRPIIGAAHAPQLAVVRDNPLPCLEGVELARIRRSGNERVIGWRVSLKLRISPAKGKAMAFDFPVGAHARDVAKAFRIYADGLDSLASEQEQGQAHGEKEGNDPSTSEAGRGLAPVNVRLSRIRALFARLLGR